MNQYGQGSLVALKGVHPDLVRLFSEVLKTIDHTVTCGVRSREEQDRLFREGKSKLDGSNPKARHVLQAGQKYGLAVDVAPYPVIYPENTKTPLERIKAYGRFYFFAGFVKAKASELGIGIRWGGDWDGDFDFADNTFDDLVHFELLMT